jgi:hypothetical protein
LPLAASVAALALAACSGGDDERQRAEIACQQRLVDVQKALPAGVAHGAIGGGFDQLRARYEALPLDGCTEQQRTLAATMARVSGRISALRQRIGDISTAGAAPSIAMNPDMMEFMNEIEGFSNRTRHISEDLARMQAAAR